MWNSPIRGVDLLQILERVSVIQAREIYQRVWDHYPPSNETQVPYRGPAFPRGTWRYSDATGFEVRLDLNPRALLLCESEEAGRAWRGYNIYVEWARAGYVPPPVSVVRHMNGRLVSLN